MEIHEYITSNGWLPATMRSYLVDVRTLFAFAVKRKYVRKTPGLVVDLPRVEENAPGILTPAQARAVLDACIDTAPDILPVVALSLLGGVAPFRSGGIGMGSFSITASLSGPPMRKRFSPSCRHRTP